MPRELNFDILALVADHLSDDQASLSRLCLTNKAIHKILLPTLYTQVTLRNTNSIVLFCRTMSLASEYKPDRLDELVHTLWIEPCLPYPDPDDSVVTRQIRCMLESLKNLERLTYIFAQIYHPFIDLFVDLDPKFQLTHFRGIFSLHGQLWAFLERQPAMTHLALTDLHPPSRFVGAFAESSNPLKHLTSRKLFLPHLNSIEGNSIVLAALCDGRPVTNVVLNNFMARQPRDPAWAIGRSAVPVRSITLRVMLWDIEREAHSAFLDSLKSTPVASSLRELSIMLDLVSFDSYCRK